MSRNIMSKAEAERVAAVGYIAFMTLTRMMFISRVGGGGYRAYIAMVSTAATAAASLTAEAW